MGAGLYWGFMNPGWYPFEWWTVSLYLSDARSIPLGWSWKLCLHVARHRKQDLLFTLWLSTGDGWHQVHPNVYSYSAAISACEKGEQLQLAAWRFIKATPCREVTGMVRKGDYSKIAESRLVNCHIWLVVWNMIFLTFHIIIGNNDRNWLSYLSEG